jgi:hypothetical protein
MTDRRQVLQMAVVAAAGVAILPGCSGSDAPEPDQTRTPDEQQADELALIAAYDAALATAKPKQAVTLQSLRDEHAAHLRALGWEDAPIAEASPEPVTRAALVRAERRAARMRADAARDATDVELAQILALIAASESQHVVTLEAL